LPYFYLGISVSFHLSLQQKTVSKNKKMASLAENGDPTTSAARALQAPRFLAGSQKKAQKDEAKEAAKQ